MLRARAFTLLELLIVVAIVAIISTIAYPAYSTYLVKARVLELFSLAESYRLRLIENNFAFMDSAIEDEDVNTKYVERVSMQNLSGDPTRYVISVVAKMRTAQEYGIGIPMVSGSEPLTITFEGVEQGLHVAWTCNVTAAYAKYVPQSCSRIL